MRRSTTILILCLAASALPLALASHPHSVSATYIAGFTTTIDVGDPYGYAEATAQDVTNTVPPISMCALPDGASDCELPPPDCSGTALIALTGATKVKVLVWPGNVHGTTVCGATTGELTVLFFWSA